MKTNLTKISILLSCFLVLVGCGGYTKYNPKKSFAYNTVRASEIPYLYVEDNKRPTGILGITPEGMVTVGSVAAGLASPAILFLPGGPWLSANMAKFNHIFGWIEANTYQEAQEKFKNMVLSWLRTLDKNVRVVKTESIFLYYDSQKIKQQIKEGKFQTDYDPALGLHLMNKRLMPQKPVFPSIKYIVYNKKKMIPEWVAPGNKMGFVCSISMGIVKSIPETVVLGNPYFFYFSAPTKEKAPYLFSWEGKRYFFVKPDKK